MKNPYTFRPVETTTTGQEAVKHDYPFMSSAVAVAK